VVGNSLASALYVDGRPILLNWSDCTGSIGQELCHVENVSREDTVAEYRRLVEQGPEPDRPLCTQFDALLGQFTAGHYLLNLAPLDERDYTIGWESDLHPIGRVQWYYPDVGSVLLSTQPDERLDGDTVLYHLKRIEKGTRPIVVTASVTGAFCEFVLDGHHKLVAYGLARILPWRLCIESGPSLLSHKDWPVAQVGAPPRSWERCMAER